MYTLCLMKLSCYILCAVQGASGKEQDEACRKDGWIPDNGKEARPGTGEFACVRGLRAGIADNAGDVGGSLMRKGICIGTIPGKDFEEKFANAAKYGFEGVEVNTLRSDEERQICRDVSEKYAVPVFSVMNSDHWQYPLSDPDPAVRERSLEGLKQSILTATYMGAGTVLVVPGVVKPDVTYEQAYERSIQSLKQILPFAADKGVQLAVENVWNKFLLSPVEFAGYVDHFESEYLAAYFDVGNIVAYGYPQHWIRTLRKRIKRIHIKGFDAQSHSFGQLLEGTIDWNAVMTALRDIGYDGYVTAEMGVDKDDPLGGLKKISEDMDAIFAL